jgi:hypothetical protein
MAAQPKELKIKPLLDRIPAMDDLGVAALRENAERLSREGTDEQKHAAVAMLEAVSAEIARRAAQKKEAMAEARRQKIAAGR